MPVVQKFYTLSLILGFMLIGSTAHAKISSYQCFGGVADSSGKMRGLELNGSQDGALSLITHEDILQSSKVLGQPLQLASSWRLEADPKNANSTLLLDGHGATLGKLGITDLKEGRKGYVTLGDDTLFCEFSNSDQAAEGFAYQAAIKAWGKFKAKQPKSCSPAADSQETILESRPKVTVVFLQGYAISPGHMAAFQYMFAELGVNVLVPRLRGHFDNDPRDLDRVAAEEWIQQSEEVLKIASKMSPKVIVAGYSLGGLLASRLALLHPDKVSALLAFSPAWRVTTKIKAGSAIGSLLGISANEFMGGTVQRCGIYISAQGGREVERVGSLTEAEAGGSEYGASNSAFRKFAMPSLVATILDDDTVDGPFVLDARGERRSTRSPTLIFNKGNHMAWIYGANTMQPDISPFKGQMSEQVKRFFAVNKLLD